MRLYSRILTRVKLESRKAIRLIRKCLETDQFSTTEHFAHRMEQRGLFWPDVQAVIDKPDDVRSQGMDDYNRPKWIISGQAADGGEVEIICAVETDESGTVFITLYWSE